MKRLFLVFFLVAVLFKSAAADDFQEVIYLWKEYDQSNVEEILKYFTPDIVIEEVVERILPLE